MSKMILGRCNGYCKGREDGERDFLLLVDVLNIYNYQDGAYHPKAFADFAAASSNVCSGSFEAKKTSSSACLI